MNIFNIFWNLAGLSVPLVIAVISIPQLLTNIGQERLGLLTLAWGLIGYAGILDFGIGRALTKLIANMIGSGDHGNIKSAVHTAIKLTLYISIPGSVFICFAAVIGSIYSLKVENISNFELILSSMIFSAALPFQAISATYKGINEAYLNFKSISLIRVLLGAFTFGLPLLISFFTISLPAIISSLAISRLFSTALYWHYSKECTSCLEKNAVFYSANLRSEMLKFGGWFSVSNIINPIISSLDRIFIGSIVASSAIAAYAIPYEFTVQSLILVGAVTTVSFPYFTTALKSDFDRANKFFLKILLLVTAAMTIIAFIQYLYAAEILTIWLDGRLNDSAGTVIEILSFGLVPYTIGTMSVSLLHSHGRTDLTAKIHLCEFLLFIIIIYYFVKAEGVVGAAKAWVIRTSIDALFISIAAYVISKNKKLQNLQKS